jgi:dTDP-4-dehydrorhamnose 3,5-epimerase
MDGVILTPLKRIPSEKGDVLHGMKSTESTFCGFGEAYFTQIRPGYTKGWKRHNRMTLNLVVVHGKVKFVVYDEQEMCFEEIILSPESNFQRLTLAPGLWMAFHGMGDEVSTVMDIIPEPHDPTEADNVELSEIDYHF